LTAKTSGKRIATYDMPIDELRQPLRRRSLVERLWSRRPGAIPIVYVFTILAYVAGAAWVMRIPYPFAGEPVVTSLIPPVEEVTTASVEPPVDENANVTEVTQSDEKSKSAQSEPEPDEEQDDAVVEGVEPTSDPGQRKAAVIIEAPVEQDVYRQESSIIISPRRALAAAPATGLVELSELGGLPKVGSGNRKPSTVYARPVSLNVIHSDAPKIAIVLGGMGLNPKLTSRAVKELPADVTLAFAPYGSGLQAQVDAARTEGHEVMLQVPLEPVGYPASNPGPRTLLADASKGENTDALYWHMSRFSGYVGIVNYMGGKFLSSAAALTPLLAETRKRGLLFVEDGSLPLSATSGVAKSTHADVRRANTVIDSDPSPKSIAAALQLLEQEAQANGFAIGTGSGFETTIEAVRDWAREAGERGIVIIPVSAAFKGRLG
jgi:hypothetical protein